MAKVSVIMPLYNQEQYIRECLDSVVKQSLKDIEIIIVNDGSTDKSLEIVQEYANNDARIKIINKPNSGYGHSMNVGIDSATGEYIGIVETDDFVVPDMYQILYEIAIKHKVDIVKADFARFEMENDKIIEQRERIAPKNYCNKILNPSNNIKLFHIIKMNTWTGIYNTEWLRNNNIRHNETPGASFQDNGFWFQTTMYANSIYLYNGKPLYYNRRDNPNSSVYSKTKVFCNCEEYKFIENILRKNKELFDKYKYIFQFKKFTNYLWHLRRISTYSPEWSQPYLENFHKEFKNAKELGLLDKETFESIDANYWETLTELLDAPECLIDVEKEKEYLLSKLFFLEPNYQENCVHVCFASDKNYVPMLSVAINSIIKTASDTVNYDIIILEEELSDKIKEDIINQRNNMPNISIRFYNMKNLMRLYSCKDLFTINHITVAAYYRLFVSTVFQNFSKIIYLDCDVVLRHDIAELFATNLHDKTVAAAVNLGMTIFNKKSKLYAEVLEYMSEVLNIKNLDNYFNSGVMIFDIEKMKERDVEKDLFRMAKINNKYMHDQNVLNSIFQDDVFPLDIKWNYQWHVKYKYPDYAEQLHENLVNEIEDASINPYIIHFLTPTKPWNNFTWEFGDFFWENAKNTPFENKLIELKDDYNKEFKITVIIPVYNSEQYLEKCLNSITSQTLKEIEIICVNDGSIDNSLSILTKLSHKDKRIKIINQNNMGAGAARNNGIKKAKGAYVCFMDADDWYPSNDILKTLYDAALANDVKICGGSFSSYFNGQVITKYMGEQKKYTFNKSGIIKYKDYQFDYGYHRFIYNTGFLTKNKIKFPLYVRYQDPPFFIKAMIKAEKFYAVDKIVYRYRKGHQDIDWTTEKVCDLMSGIRDSLILSKENKLAELHYLNLKRLKHDFRLIIEEKIKEKNIKVLKMIGEIISIYDRDLYYKGKKAYEKVSVDDKEIRRLKEEKESIEKSFSFRLGRFLTAPFRAFRRLVRCIRENGLKYTCKKIVAKLKSSRK